MNSPSSVRRMNDLACCLIIVMICLEKLRDSLEDARTRVAELETQNLDAKLEIDSLKDHLLFLMKQRFYGFSTNPSAESFVRSRARF
jgi:hypothetical protein